MLFDSDIPLIQVNRKPTEDKLQLHYYLPDPGKFCQQEQMNSLSKWETRQTVI